MNKATVFIIVLLLISLHVQSAGIFVKNTFYSQSLDQEKPYFVSLPDGYKEADTVTKYPVIVFLHGASVDAQDMVDLIEPVLSNPLSRILFQNIFKVIFVIADGSAPPYQGSFYTNSALYGNYEDYIASDLLAEIKSKYHTYNARQKWSIMGHSMGGYGSMKIALKHSDQFIGVASLSGPLDITYYDEILPLVLAENGDAPPYNFTYQGNITKLVFSMAGAFSPNTTNDPPVFFPISSDGTVNQEIMPQWEANNPINYIREWKGNPKMAIFFYCGGKDGYKLLPENQFFSDTLDAYQIAHTFVEDPQGDHVNSLITSFPQGLNFLYNVMDTATIVTEPSAITEFNTRSNFVFPNPVRDRLYLSKKINDARTSISVLTVNGSLIKRYTTEQVNNGIPSENLSPGVYFLSVQEPDRGNQLYRFLKIY